MNKNFKGAQTPFSASSEFNVFDFGVRQILNQANTATLVEVVAVESEDGVAPVGFVDVLPLVSQLDGHGNSVPHNVIYHIPYVRMQGGANAVILDPQIGDIGIAVFADRDISAIKEIKKAGLPGSGRRFSMADAMYIGGMLNGTPTQYVQFSAAGINITSPAKVTITAPEIDVVGALKNNGVNVGSAHVHGGVSLGTDSTSGPG